MSSEKFRLYPYCIHYTACLYRHESRLIRPTASFLIIIFAVAQTVAEDYLVVIISAALRNVVNAVVANNLRISMQRVGQFAYVCPEYSSDLPMRPPLACPRRNMALNWTDSGLFN